MTPRSSLPSAIRGWVPALVIGIVASAIWWALTQSPITAGAALAGIALISYLLWRNLPTLVRIEEIARSEIVRVFEDQAAAAPAIVAAAADARRVRILSVRGLGILGLNGSVLRELLTERGAAPRRIEVLLLAPDGAAAGTRAIEVGESADAFSHGLDLGLQRLRELTVETRHELAVYLYDELPAWRLIALDDALFISSFGSAVEGHRSRMYQVDGRKQSTIATAITRMFDDMITRGTRVI
jgi:hypothetical protein